MGAKENGAELGWENDVHIVLAAKGGIGKTYISSLLAQYAASNGKPMKVFDLDQSNAMLARIPSLHATPIQLLKDARFDTGLFDDLLRRIVSESGPFLLDVGASTFQDLWRYFDKYKAVSLLKAQKRRVIIHSVLVGGPEMPDTISSFADMAKAVPGKQIIVWLNPVRGEIAMAGKTFEQMSVYANNLDKVLAVVDLPAADESTLKDLHQLALKNETLSTLEDDAEFDFIAKHRLTVHRGEIYDAMGSVWGALGGSSN